MDYLPATCAARSIGPANNLISTLLTTLVAAHCNMSNPDYWPTNYTSESLKAGLEGYDFVVIGGGTAGAVVASRLAENPDHKVLLLEAGRDPPIEAEIPGLSLSSALTKYDWKYPTISNGISCLARDNGSCTLHKGKMLGGSSSLNGILHLRGNSRDYDEWEQQGNPTWGWREVLPYFKKFESFRGYSRHEEHGMDGPVSFEPFRSSRTVPFLMLRAAKELGHRLVDDFVGGSDVGFGLLYGGIEDGRQINTAKAYLVPPKPNLDIIKSARVRKIRFDDKKDVESLSFVYKGKTKVNVKRPTKEVIISAGTIETAKLLMLSGVGPEAHLTTLKIPVVSDIRVGDNLQEHAKVDLLVKFQYDSKGDAERRALEATFRQWAFGEGPLASPGYAITGYTKSGRKERFPDIQYTFTPIDNVTAYVSKFNESYLRNLEQEVGPKERLVAIGVTVLNPLARGIVRLSGRDYRDTPLIVPNSFSKKEDVDVMLRGIKEALEFERTHTFKKLKAKFLKPELPDCERHVYKSPHYWGCYMQFMSDISYNPVGTAKMGNGTDTTAVVDAELRVRGVKGLRVIDSSIMPTIPSADTTGPTIMIAEKGVDLVKQEYRV